MRVAYVVSKFPSTTETFIAREMSAVTRLGVDVSLFSLVHQADAVVHPEAQPFLDRLHATKPWSSQVLAAQLYWLRRDARRYLAVWRDALRGNRRSPEFLLRALAVVPVAAWYARIAQRKGVEHVHAHWLTHSGLAAWVMHRLAGLPYSMTGHAHDIYVDRSMLGEKLAECSFAAIISDYGRQLLADEYGSDVASRLHIVRCGVDPALFPPRSLPDDGPQGSSDPSGDQPLRVLVIASLQDYKGHAVLVDAVALLAARGIDVRVRLLGDGPLRAELEAQVAARGVGDQVTFVGSVPSDQVRAELAATDVMALPSIITASGKMEGIPVALMEALAGEVAVVASRLAGIPELVIDGSTGLLVTPADPVALADALARLAADPALRQRLGAAGRELVLREFTVEGNARRLAELWGAVPASAQPMVASA